MTIGKTLGALLGVMIWIGSASAATGPFETVNLRADLQVTQCRTTGASGTTCETNPPSPTDVAIPLGICSGTNAINVCYGSWEGFRVQDSFTFEATVTVTKTVVTDNQGKVSTHFILFASVGPMLDSQAPGEIEMDLNRGGTLTDSVSFSGPRLFLSNPGDSDLASLRISPATPASGSP